MPGRSPRARAAALAAVTTRRRPSRPIRIIGASGGGAAAPSLRRSRSVGQVGRKSETTRCIAGLHLEIGTFPGAAADQLDQPARPADAGHRQRGRGQGGHPPAGHRRGRLPEIRGLGRAPPAAHARSRSSLTSRRRAAAGARRSSTGAPPRPPPRRAHRAAGLPRQQASTVCSSPASTWITRSGSSPAWLKAGCEQVEPGHAPQHDAAGTGDDAGREQRRGGTVDSAISATRHLMQGAQRQPAFGQAGVDGRHPERQHASAHTASRLDLGDARAQRVECGTRPHGRLGPPGSAVAMFSICSP